MNRGKNWFISICFIATDILILGGVFYLTMVVRNWILPITGQVVQQLGKPVVWQQIEPMVQICVILGIGTFLIQGLYPGYGMTSIKELSRLIKSVTLVFFLVAGISYLNKPYQDFPRSILVIAWVLALGLIPVSHFILRNLLSRSGWYGNPVILFGEGKWARQVEKSLHNARRLGWKVYKVHPLVEIQNLSKTDPSQIAILAPTSGTQIENLARILSTKFHRVVLIREKDNFGSLWVEPRDLEGQLGLEFHYHLLEPFSIIVKRLLDFFGALTLLIIASPIFLFVTLFILVDSRGPVFFRHKRVGRNFKPILVLKFRTMVADADQNLPQLLESSEAARLEFEQFHKLKNDPRVTRVGKWLRKLYIDEIPQLWNVLKGEMSLVGPRPVVDFEIKKMGTYAPVILRVNPGMTGWWQVTGRHEIDFFQRIRLEEYYISNWSLWMDIYILIKTVWVVLKGKGA